MRPHSPEITPLSVPWCPRMAEEGRDKTLKGGGLSIRINMIWQNADSTSCTSHRVNSFILSACLALHKVTIDPGFRQAKRESVVWLSGESYLMIRCLMSHSEIVRHCIFTSPLLEWFIQIFPCDWSYCSRLEMTNDSEGFSFRHWSSSGRKRFRSFTELQLGTPIWQIVILKKYSCTITPFN